MNAQALPTLAEPAATEDAHAGTFRAWRAASLAAVLAFVLVAPLALNQGHSYDGVHMKRVAVELAEHGTPLASQPHDQYGFNQPYSGYGIGTSLVMAPLYLVGKSLTGDGVKWLNLANALMFAATAAVVVETLRRRGPGLRTIAIATALTALATPLLAYALTDFSEPGVALTIAVSVLALDGVGRHSRFAALGLGAAVGGAVLFRSDSLVTIAPIVFVAMLVLSHRRARDCVLFAAGAVPALAVWSAYNVARFDSLVSSGYRHQPFSHDFLSGVYGLTLSPGRGVFVYVPLLIAAVPVMRSLVGPARVVGFVAIALLVARVLLYARWWSWYGGNTWGPRFLVPVLPAFAPLIAAAIERWHERAWFRTVVAISAVAAALGVWMTVRPGTNGYVAPPMREGDARTTIAHVTSPAYVTQTDEIMFDWGSFPFGPTGDDARRDVAPSQAG
jgi:hypothetical protein